jgi:hypothetical protein
MLKSGSRNNGRECRDPSSHVRIGTARAEQRTTTLCEFNIARSDAHSWMTRDRYERMDDACHFAEHSFLVVGEHDLVAFVF